MSDSPRQQLPIAIVGVSTLFPGSTDARGFWNDILAGKDLITDVPETHWLIDDYYDPDPKALDKTYCKRGGFMPKVDFDPLAFGLPPTVVPATDSAQILALIVAQKVLEDAAQGQFAQMDRDKISVLLGVTSAQELLFSMVSRLQKPVWLKALRESGIPEDEAQEICLRIANNYTPWQESSFPGLLGNVVAGRIANRFDLRGTNAVTDAACASSLAAISMGINELQTGQSDLVITGGVDAMNDIFMYMCFSKTPALSPTGDCRPFSDNADGTLIGEGIAMMALKRLDDAERDGDRIYAVIKGLGSASDGRANSVYAPLPEGQARALERTYQQAGYGPETVELMEAHGTGTKAGDAAEFAGLNMVFSKNSDDKQWCALGTVKSQIGHTKATAGAAGLFKAVMALHHKVLPPTIKIQRPNPKLNIEQSPFYLNTETRPWIRGNDHPRRASVSSFGFGGSNFHVTLEEYVPQNNGKTAWQIRTTPTELVLLHANSATELSNQCRSLAQDKRELSTIARESQLNFQASPARLAIIASSREELADKLNTAANSIAAAPDTAYQSPNGVFYATGAADAGQIAFIFPGQGSQYVGMGADVAMGFAAARQAWDDAANTRFNGESLHQIVFPRPVFSDEERQQQQQKLTATEWAQPALGTHSRALSNVLQQIGIRPNCVAGHSFGEVSALYQAGVFDGDALLQIARRRGELMRDASTIAGAMIAVAKPIEEVRTLLANSGANVVIANHNAPTQVIVSGATTEIEKLEASLSAAGVTSKRLPVATAFHSPLVAGSSEPLRQFLNGISINEPTMDVYNNGSAAPYPTDANSIRSQLANQLAQPVHFVAEIEAMYARGVRTFIEVGAGNVLTSLVERILGKQNYLAINLDRKGKHGVTMLQQALGQLALAGVKIDFAPLWAAFAPASDVVAKKPAMSMEILGSNHGRPYPPVGGSKALPQPNGPRPAPVTVTAAPTVTPTMSNTVPENNQANAWLAAYQETQRQTAEAHANYQRAMAESHTAYLNMIASSYAGMNSILGGAPLAAPQPMPFIAAPQVAAPVAPVVPSVAWGEERTPTQAVSTPVNVGVPTSPQATTPIATAPAAVDLAALMMSVVADKTGYPQNMLAPHMELEADLGIDSIKRVEILSAMREREPNLPEVKPAELANLRTLGQIIDHMRAANANVGVPASPQPTMVDLAGLMMAVVAEKTGYPQNMLAPHMELEADLGIDSIKRVEILSAMRERAPSLPEVKPAELANLRTLGQIIDHMQSNVGWGDAETPTQTESTSTNVGVRTSPQPTLDLESLMMSVVAEKTGYPQNMLAPHMELEADLGIDSIKRVEILSAMRERAPNLPEVKPAELANLRTLGQIIDHMQSNVGWGDAGTPTQTESTSTNVGVRTSPQPTLDLESLMMSVVAEKTGYPQAMLAPHMELEADLGIDSIKRVEILSAMRERAPNLPEVKPAELANLRTLGQIINHMRAAETPTQAANTSTNVGVRTSPQPTLDLEALMMSVVAEKTGYPQAMLAPHMELEADLGIDSIKRVEILSAMREREPNLPEVKPAELANLRTLGQIIEHMRGNVAWGDTATPTQIANTSTNVGALSSSQPTCNVKRNALREVEASPIGMALSGLLGAKNLVVTDDGAGVACAVVELLKQQGIAASLVSQVPAQADAVIFLGGLRPVSNIEQAIAINREAFQACRAIAERFTQHGGTLVTVQNTGGDFGLSGADATRAYLGGISALARTAALEWPLAAVKAIDLQATDIPSAAQAIVNELLNGGTTLEVGLHADGRRTSLQSVATNSPVALANNINKDSVIIASGGGRGVTANCLIALAKAKQPTIVLLGRTQLSEEPALFSQCQTEASLKQALLKQAQASGHKATPAQINSELASLMAQREIRQTLAELQAAGSKATYLNVDVANTEALNQALATIRRQYGAITGIVHGAGVLADKRIAEKTDEQFNRVFDTKINGLRALLSATANDPIKAICLFSSIAARTGNLGQCDYAMANEVLNLVACAERARRGADCIVRAIGWGPWDGGMVTPSLKAHFQQMGVDLIPLDAGAQCFVAEMLGDSNDINIVIGATQGSGALGATTTPSATLEIKVKQASHPQLVDHTIAGVPVVPMVLVVEWFIRAARACRPTLVLTAVQQLKVLRGIKLQNYHGAGDRFIIQARQLSNGDGALIGVELRNADGVLHYSATVKMAHDTANAPHHISHPTLDDWKNATVYDGHVLFHGPSFHVIDSVLGVSREGIVGTLSGLAGNNPNWPQEPWCSDVAALDGGLQLALLWSKQVLGGAVLPMAMGEYRSYRDELPHESVQCIIHAQKILPERSVCDIHFLDSQGQFAELLGVETVLRPSGSA